MKKTKIGFLALILSSMAIVACGETGDNGSKGDAKCKHKYGEPVVTVEATEQSKGKQTKTCTKCGYVKEDEIPMLPPKYDVIIKDANGAEISNTKIAYGTALTKPADPTAPAGKKFYGWKNVLNGNQIWNFDKEDVNKVAGPTTLEPLFVDNYDTKYLEAELCSVITDVVYETNPDGTTKMDDKGKPVVKKNGMDGATYSGGAKGAQLIYKDFGSEFSTTTMIDPFYYYKDENGDIIPCDATNENATKVDPVGDGYGYAVHFNYIKGNTLTWNINSSKAVENAALFGRFSAEYGLPKAINADIEELRSTFNSNQVKIKINDQVVNYGEITIHFIVDKSFITFEDFYLGNINLNEGANKVELIVDNNDTLNGTIASTCPCIDSLKIVTDSTITWSEAKLINLVL